MAMSLASVESTRGRPGVGNLRYAANDRAYFVASQGSCFGGAPGKHLGYAGKGGVESSHCGCNILQETVILIYHPTNSRRDFTVESVGMDLTAATFS